MRSRSTSASSGCVAVRACVRRSRRHRTAQRAHRRRDRRCDRRLQYGRRSQGSKDSWSRRTRAVPKSAPRCSPARRWRVPPPTNRRSSRGIPLQPVDYRRAHRPSTVAPTRHCSGAGGQGRTITRAAELSLPAGRPRLMWFPGSVIDKVAGGRIDGGAGYRPHRIGHEILGRQPVEYGDGSDCSAGPGRLVGACCTDGSMADTSWYQLGWRNYVRGDGAATRSRCCCSAASCRPRPHSAARPNAAADRCGWRVRRIEVPNDSSWATTALRTQALPPSRRWAAPHAAHARAAPERAANRRHYGGDHHARHADEQACVATPPRVPGPDGPASEITFASTTTKPMAPRVHHRGAPGGRPTATRHGRKHPFDADARAECGQGEVDDRGGSSIGLFENTGNFCSTASSAPPWYNSINVTTTIVKATVTPVRDTLRPAPHNQGDDTHDHRRAHIGVDLDQVVLGPKK